MANPYVAALGLVVDVGTKLAQGRTEEAFGGLNPFASAGAPLTVTIPSGSQVQVPHKLGKVPVGYQMVCKMGEGDIWDYQAPDKTYFYLENGGAGDVTVKLVVS